MIIIGIIQLTISIGILITNLLQLKEAKKNKTDPARYTTNTRYH